MNKSTSVHFPVRLRYIWFRLATSGWISQALLPFELILLICVLICLNLCQCSTTLMSNLVERVFYDCHFSALHCMQAWSRRRKAVCIRLSVCPSVRNTPVLWQNERKSCGHSYTTWRKTHQVFWQEEWVTSPSTWNFGRKSLQKRRFSIDIRS